MASEAIVVVVPPFFRFLAMAADKFAHMFYLESLTASKALAELAGLFLGRMLTDAASTESSQGEVAVPRPAPDLVLRCSHLLAYLTGGQAVLP